MHLFAVALASGVGFINLWCLYVAKGQPVEILKGIAFQQKSLRNFGYGLVITIGVTGILQLVNSGGLVGVHGWFDAKLFFAAIWLIAYIAMRISVAQIAEQGTISSTLRVRMLAHISWVSAAIAMFCAVMAFAS